MKNLRLQCYNIPIINDYQGGFFIFYFYFYIFSSEEEYPNSVELVIQGMIKGLMFEKGPENILELEKWKRMERIE